MAVHITRAGVALTAGIIVLTGALTGGLLWVRGTGEQARRDEAIAIAESQLESQSNEEAARNESNDQTSTSNEGASGDTQTDTTTNSNSSTLTTDALPQTGPSDIGAIVAVGSLTYAAFAYRQSLKRRLDIL